MAVAPQEILTLLKKRLPDADIELQDTRGTQDHYHVSIRSDAFKGQSRIQQHQLVYQALGELLAGDLHAVSLKTSPKEE